MGRASFKVMIVLFLLSGGVASAQVSLDLKNSKSPFTYEPVIIVDIHDNVYKGIFIELRGDSLALLFDSKILTVALNSLKQLRILSNRDTKTNMLNAGIVGEFAAQLLLSKSEWQSDSYVQADGLGSNIIVGVLGAAAGGLIGLGVDIANKTREMRYNLQDPEEIQRLKMEVNPVTDGRKLNFYYEIAKVYTRTEPSGNPGQGNYYSYNNSSVNVLRSLKLTYDLSDKIEAGIAYYSAAEPNLMYQSYSQYTYLDESMTNSVHGYYAMAYYDLLNKSGQISFSLKPGIGCGFVNLDYTIFSRRRIQDPVTYSYTTTTESSNLKKTVFSGFAGMDARFYTMTGVSISITADYIFIPEKTLPSAMAGEGGKSFSNFSLGLSLGIHM